MSVTWPLVVAIGFAAGVLSGMFGIGGALATTPAIRLLLEQPALIAVGTPLPVIIPTAVAGAISYARRGLADVRTGVAIGLAGAVFTLLGARATTLVGGEVVLLVTAALIVWTAVDMLYLAYRPDRPESERAAHAERTHSWLWVGCLGAVTGLYSGFLGLGGGFIVVPALIRFFAFPAKRAVGTSLVAVSLLAIPGSIAHYLLGNVNVELALLLTVGVVPGAMLGARITAVAAERRVRVGFALMLLVAAAALVSSELGLI